MHPIDITTHKLVDLNPTWAPFAGWSILFDNPGIPSRVSESPFPTTSADRTVLAPLYERLADLIPDLVSDFDEPGLAWLPSRAYHVTLADGISQRHVERMAQSNAKSHWAQLLGRLPSSVADIRRLLRADGGPWNDLMGSAPAPAITFEVESLELRGHALVAGLRPSTTTDGRLLQHLENARDTAVAALAADTGLSLLRPWQPHVTLGYAANLETGETLVPKIAGIVGSVRHRLSDVAITFRSADVYVYTSMIEFWK